MNETLRRH